jgi:DNA-binding MarR family transcriptional regulator
MNPPGLEARRRGKLLHDGVRLQTRVQRVVADCCRTGSTQGPLLVELGLAGPLPLTELGARLRLEKSRVSRAVDGRVERGRATKEPNPLDARSRLVTLFADGEDRVRTHHAAGRAHTVHAPSCGA